MASRWRLTRLTVSAKLRSLGFAPWTVLVAWSAVAAAGEPSLLRSFGIRIQHHATHALALLILAAVLLAPGSPRAASARLLANVTLGALVAGIAGLVSFTVDLAFGKGPALASACGDTSYGFVANLPLCAAVAVPAATSVTQTTARTIVMAISAAAGAGFLVRSEARAAGMPNAWAAVALAGGIL